MTNDRNSMRFPLAHDLDGNPIALPPEAAGWRVRRRSGKQGRPQCVYDHETGAQLELQLDADIDDLRDYGPGVYRLDAIDGDGKVMAGVIAQTEVTALLMPSSDEKEPHGPQASALIRHLVDANVRVMESMATAFGHVRPVSGAPMFVEGGDEKQDTAKKLSELEKMNLYYNFVVEGAKQLAKTFPGLAQKFGIPVPDDGQAANGVAPGETS